MLHLLSKHIIQPIKWSKYHNRHKRDATSVLKTIEEEKGKTPRKLINLSNEYARDILGWEGYASWLYVYSAIKGDFKEGWIPDNYYGKIVVPKIKGDYGEISYLKPLTNLLFRSSLFPDIGCFVNGVFVDREYKILEKSKVKNYFFSHHEKIIFKLDNSRQGKGVFFFDKNSFNLSKILALGNGVFQEYINQHGLFEQFTSKSVATLRITTVIDANGNPSLRACYLRVGQGEDTHVKSSSHIRIPIDLESGTFNTIGYLPNWLTTDIHPSSGIKFENLEIPEFKSCIASVLELHKSMPFARAIGWDVIVDKENQVKVMEWNGSHNDIKFSEATQGPSFSDLGWDGIWKNHL